MRMDKGTLSVVVIVSVAAIASCFGEGLQTEGALQSWIGALIGGVLNIAGGIMSARQADKAASQAQAERAMAEAELQRWYEARMNENILDRADTLSMLKQYRDWQEEHAKKFQNSAIKGGATEEGKVAYAQQANKGYAEAVSKIAAQGQARKDRADDIYMQSKMGIHNQAAQDYMQSGQQTANTISSGFSSLGNALGSIEWGKEK